VPESQPYGPNGAAVRRFLQRFAALRPAEWQQAADAFERLQGTRAFGGADRALAAAVAAAGREDARDAVLGPLAQLVRLPSAPVEAAPDAGADAADAVTLHPVAEAALAALLALVVRDVLSASALATLYSPFDALVPIASLDETPAR
jgi:hypothetical protein